MYLVSMSCATPYSILAPVPQFVNYHIFHIYLLPVISRTESLREVTQNELNDFYLNEHWVKRAIDISMPVFESFHNRS